MSEKRLRMKHQLTGKGGKGSAPRAVDRDKFDANFDRIFGNKKKFCCEGGLVSEGCNHDRCEGSKDKCCKCNDGMIAAYPDAEEGSPESKVFTICGCKR